MFNEMFNTLMDVELGKGGYVATYVGNEDFRTIAGITEKFYPDAKIWKVLNESEEVKREAVKDFYYTTFYKKMYLDRLNSYPIGLVVFNLSVLFGKRKTSKIIQRILKVKQDGILGDVTFGKLKEADQKAFTYEFLLEATQFIDYLTDIKYKRMYLKGWMSRIVKLFSMTQKYFLERA